MADPAKHLLLIKQLASELICNLSNIEYQLQKREVVECGRDDLETDAEKLAYYWCQRDSKQAIDNAIKRAVFIGSNIMDTAVILNKSD